MHHLEATIASIEQKVGKLIDENKRLQIQVIKMQKENEKLQKENENNIILINNLQEKNKILKLGNALTQKGDSAEIKLKINQLIRSIDKSLASLTKIE